MRLRAPLCVVLLLASASSAALELTLDRRAIDEALALGRSSLDRDRVRFHALYRLAVRRAPVDYVDIVTPFRRVVLAAEQAARLADRSFGQRQAVELVAAGPEQIDLWVELTFHPMNVYVGVPDYAVTLVPIAGSAIAPSAVDRVPRFGPRVGAGPLPYPAPAGAVIPRGTEPMLGGTVIATFDGELLDAAALYDVVVSEKGKEIARAPVAFSALR